MENENVSVDEDEIRREFWERIEQIEDISVQVGLERVSGQRNVYESALKLLVKEIEKCNRNLTEFLAANEMQKFTIEVHGMKSSLANTGAMEISELAKQLEFAAAKEDSNFCASNLSSFLERLNRLNSHLAEAFEKKSQSFGQIRIPPELSPIFEKMIRAFEKTDFLVIGECIKSLDALDLSGLLKEEVEQIKDAVMMTDYESAMEMMQKLL